jgi:peptidoglycan/xylan/chitin deacetylase (PgdA/CDA1 family)
MYQDTLIKGRSSLGDKTLCLTFDDGPGQTSSPLPQYGPRTLELARYLNSRGIRATFFVVGKYAVELPEVLQELRELGHLVGNHTFDHASLLQGPSGADNAVSEIVRTDSAIRNYVDGPVVYFRPPYGHWDASIASRLNASAEASAGHAGPVGWDIDANDWQFWERGRSPRECADLYLRLIRASRRRGITLMHDCTADQDAIKMVNRTFELIQFLVPELEQQDYTFVRLDEIPEIAAAAQPDAGPF